MVENLTNPHIKAFVSSMLRENKKASYINTILKVLRSFLIYCVDEGYLQFDFSKFKWLKEEKVIIQTFTNMQAKQLISFYRKNDYNSVKNKTIIMTLFETGIRCYELCCLRLDDDTWLFMVKTINKEWFLWLLFWKNNSWYIKEWEKNILIVKSFKGNISFWVERADNWRIQRLNTLWNVRGKE